MDSNQRRPLLVVGIGLPVVFRDHLAECPEIRCVMRPGSALLTPFGLDTLDAELLVAGSQLLTSANARFWASLRARPRPVSVVAVAGPDGPGQETELLFLGCAGALSEDAPPAEIGRALHAVAAGELWFPRMSLSQAIRSLLPTPAERRLTPRERQILQMIGQGRNNREIAEALFISRETVRWHVRSLNAKFGLHDRRQVASLAGNPPGSSA